MPDSHQRMETPASDPCAAPSPAQGAQCHLKRVRESRGGPRKREGANRHLTTPREQEGTARRWGSHSPLLPPGPALHTSPQGRGEGWKPGLCLVWEVATAGPPSSHSGMSLSGVSLACLLGPRAARKPSFCSESGHQVLPALCAATAPLA